VLCRDTFHRLRGIAAPGLAARAQGLPGLHREVDGGVPAPSVNAQPVVAPVVLPVVRIAPVDPPLR
jgi:hypothetical protein